MAEIAAAFDPTAGTKEHCSIFAHIKDADISKKGMKLEY
jgi:hypothetical protein